MVQGLSGAFVASRSRAPLAVANAPKQTHIRNDVTRRHERNQLRATGVKHQASSAQT